MTPIEASQPLELDPILLAVLAFGAGAVLVGAMSSVARERIGGYWILAWGTLVLAGGFFFAAATGRPGAQALGYLADGLFAPLMLMGAYALHGRQPRYAWPLLLGGLAGLARVGLGESAPLGLGLGLALTVAPICFLLASILTFRAPTPQTFGVPIALLFGALAGFELWDAWNDWVARDNRVLWQPLMVLCFPLAAMQITSRLFALRRGLVTAEEASEEAYRERDLERWRFHVLFDRSRDLVAELGPDSRILYVNAYLRELLGIEPSEVTGRLALDLVPDERRAAAEALWARQREPDGIPEGVEYPFPHRDGRSVWLQVMVSKHVADGAERLLVIARDITGRRREEERTKAVRAELEQRVAEGAEKLRASLIQLRDQERLATVGTLASGIAHQINNPVGAISAAAEFALIARDDPDGPAIQQASLERIRDEAQRAGEVVKSILRFARHGSTHKWSEDLSAVVGRAANIARAYVEEQGGRITLELCPDPLWVVMSPIEIEQMTINLVRNAAEARRRPGTAAGVAIAVRTFKDGGRVLLEVEDDGDGIPEEQRRQVFDPFFTTRLREGGSGLGLAVVHGIVTDHQGTIDFDSEVGRGTLVRIAFAIGAPPAASDPAVDQLDAKPELSAVASPRRNENGPGS